MKIKCKENIYKLTLLNVVRLDVPIPHPRCMSVPCNWGTHSYCAKTHIVIRNYAQRS